jgi:hypothetical protein
MSVLVEKVNEQEREAITSCVGCMKEDRWFVLHYYTPRNDVRPSVCPSADKSYVVR